MNAISFLPRQAQVLQHLFGYQAESNPAEVGPEVDRFTIAVSREEGTPAVEVAAEVGGRLGWTVYDREIPACIARELCLSVGSVEQIDERGQSWLLDCMQAFLARRELSDSRYFRCLIAVIRSLGEQGRGIIIGHGAAHILPPRWTLRVLLVGDREDRISVVSRRFHLDRRAAARELEETSHARRRFIREHFHTDPTKARHYDLVLNTSQWSPPDCADFIVAALHHKATGHLKG
ncbi:MAG TPA: cytidylate kinase-like family protein [Gemmataceae bacterium]|jgi:hypothetical protein